MTPQESKNTALKPNQALLAGRVNAVRKADEYVYTEITLPAPDEYTSPQSVEVRSRKRLGQVGETIETRVLCGGYRGKPFQFTDKETGERHQRRPVLNVYSALED
ncbi:hypothetical protein [Jeongeupia chitinilytica]|uniref:Single-stranded DNA-binding protein n=1 Tax=Jeongeupia chitinilytica TaxID=1041641 RepID=A0ABQ3H1V6_9NEIS|nr:hypothetical protein [Jeongeupia chitinilytica]GHD66100.1 hypothetical protein GCM10007350_27820 [Jeongeupia chitinilytica]